MSKIKISAGLFRMHLNYSDLVPCIYEPTANCNTSSARLFEFLFNCGSNISSFYGGPKCKHGKPCGDEGLVAFILERYYETPLKFTEAGSTLLSMLYGSAAILYFDNGVGKKSQLDIWDGQKLLFEKRKLTDLRPKSVSIWIMGHVNVVQAKSQHHAKHAKHVIHIF